MANFSDILVDEKANAAISDFVARKIRQCVKDPKVADKLIPTDHGFGTRRLPLESGYFEAYNRDNVLLVDLNETPIEGISSSCIRTSDKEYEFDFLIYATGYDAVTGAASTFAPEAAFDSRMSGPTGRAPILVSWPKAFPIC
jgi:cation diffusion facilitator CzcD-associated flavoprotein CzcO